MVESVLTRSPQTSAPVASSRKARCSRAWPGVSSTRKRSPAPTRSPSRSGRTSAADPARRRAGGRAPGAGTARPAPRPRRRGRRGAWVSQISRGGRPSAASASRSAKSRACSAGLRRARVDHREPALRRHEPGVGVGRGRQRGRAERGLEEAAPGTRSAGEDAPSRGADRGARRGRWARRARGPAARSGWAGGGAARPAPSAASASAQRTEAAVDELARPDLGAPRPRGAAPGRAARRSGAAGARRDPAAGRGEERGVEREPVLLEDRLRTRSVAVEERAAGRPRARRRSSRSGPRASRTPVSSNSSRTAQATSAAASAPRPATGTSASSGSSRPPGKACQPPAKRRARVAADQEHLAAAPVRRGAGSPRSRRPRSGGGGAGGRPGKVIDMGRSDGLRSARARAGSSRTPSARRRRGTRRSRSAPRAPRSGR